jgi:hypothetical protein
MVRIISLLLLVIRSPRRANRLGFFASVRGIIISLPDASIESRAQEVDADSGLKRFL